MLKLHYALVNHIHTSKMIHHLFMNDESSLFRDADCSNNKECKIVLSCRWSHIAKRYRSKLVCFSLHCISSSAIYLLLAFRFIWRFYFVIFLLLNMEEFFIETDRLKLFPAHPRLCQELNELILDTFETLHPWISFAQHPPTVDQTKKFLTESFSAFKKKKQFHMAVYLKDESKFIGMCGAADRYSSLEPNGPIPYDIGYWIHKSYTGKGYATEAAKGLIYFIHQEIKATLFSINCAVDNHKSSKVAEKLNFKLFATKDIPLAHNRTDWPEKVSCKIYILHFE